MPSRDDAGIFAALAQGAGLSDRALDKHRAPAEAAREWPSLELSPNFEPPADGCTAYAAYAADALSRIADTLGLSYAELTRDWSESNFRDPRGWCADLVNGAIRRSVAGPLHVDPAKLTASAEIARADLRLRGLEQNATDAEPLSRVALSGYRAGDLLRVIGCSPGTVTVSGTGTSADGEYALEQFVEGMPGEATARLRRLP